jgi:hypothetical protein
MVVCEGTLDGGGGLRTAGREADRWLIGGSSSSFLPRESVYQEVARRMTFVEVELGEGTAVSKVEIGVKVMKPLSEADDTRL